MLLPLQVLGNEVMRLHSVRTCECVHPFFPNTVSTPGQCWADLKEIKAKRISDIIYSKMEEGVTISTALQKSPHCESASLLEIRGSKQPSRSQHHGSLIPLFTSHEAFFSMCLTDKLLFDHFSIFGFEAKQRKYNSFLKTALTGL